MKSKKSSKKCPRRKQKDSQATIQQTQSHNESNDNNNNEEHTQNVKNNQESEEFDFIKLLPRGIRLMDVKPAPVIAKPWHFTASVDRYKQIVSIVKLMKFDVDEKAVIDDNMYKVVAIAMSEEWNSFKEADSLEKYYASIVDMARVFGILRGIKARAAQEQQAAENQGKPGKPQRENVNSDHCPREEKSQDNKDQPKPSLAETKRRKRAAARERRKKCSGADGEAEDRLATVTISMVTALSLDKTRGWHNFIHFEHRSRVVQKIMYHVNPNLTPDTKIVASDQCTINLIKYTVTSESAAYRNSMTLQGYVDKVNQVASTMKLNNKALNFVREDPQDTSDSGNGSSVTVETEQELILLDDFILKGPQPMYADEFYFELTRQHLKLTLHAVRCSVERGKNKNHTCDLPYCSTMNDVLEHMYECQDNEECMVPHCSSTLQLLQHHRDCKDVNCLLHCRRADVLHD